jgi:outer membrane protein assembly factor BamB
VDGYYEGIGSSPAVVNGVVYIGSDSLYAFDAAGNTNCSGTPKTCAPLWTGPTGGDVFSSPAVSNRVVYVGSIGGNVSAFDDAGNTNCSGTPRTCAPLWTDRTGSGTFPGDAVVSSPAVINGVVYIGDFLGNVSAFDAAGNTNCSGTPKVCQPLWAAGVGTNGGTASSPAVVNGTVYIGDECNLQGNPPQPVCNNPPHFYAINATTGARSWTAIGSAAAVSTSPAVANGVVFVGSGDGNLYAFDAAGSIDCSGTPTFCSPPWTGGTGRGSGSSPAIANGKVYVGSGDGKLYVFGLP